MKGILLTSLVLLGTCAPYAGAGDEAGSSLETDAQQLQRLETEARAIARTEGCTGPGQCRTAPVGDRPCGGPRDYIVYCAATTDTVALLRKLEELKQAEQAFNRKHQRVSTCEFRMPPETQLVGTTCRAR